MKPRFRFSLVSSPEERQLVYKLRYQIFVEEFGYKIPGVTAETGVREPEDEGSHLILAYDGDLPVGAIACDGWRDVSLSDELIRHYHLESFAETFSKDGIALIRKALLAKPYRGGSLFLGMVSFLYKLCQEAGIQFAFTNCSPYLVQYYEKLGFRRYASHFYLDDSRILAVPMVFLTHDLEHLRRIRSPLLAIGLKAGASDDPKSRLYLESQWTTTGLSLDVPESLALPALPPRSSSPPTVSDSMLFKDIDQANINHILTSCSHHTFHSRSVIIPEDDPGFDLYLLTDGYAEVTQKKGDQSIAIATLGPGDLFGEISFFTRRRRTANVVSLTECKVFQIPEHLLLDLKSRKPATACQLYHNLGSILAERVKATSHWVAKSPPL